MSTLNHNILYLDGFSGIQVLNIGICLWKAQIVLAPRGFPACGMPRFLCSGVFGGSDRLIDSIDHQAHQKA